MELDRLLELGELRGGERSQLGDPLLLARITRGELRQRLDLAIETGSGGFIGVQVSRVAGEQVALLSALGVFDQCQGTVDPVKDPVGIFQSLHGCRRFVDVAVREYAGDEQNHRGQGKLKPQTLRET